MTDDELLHTIAEQVRQQARMVEDAGFHERCAVLYDAADALEHLPVDDDASRSAESAIQGILREDNPQNPAGPAASAARIVSALRLRWGAPSVEAIAEVIAPCIDGFPAGARRETARKLAVQVRALWASTGKTARRSELTREA